MKYMEVTFHRGFLGFNRMVTSMLTNCKCEWNLQSFMMRKHSDAWILNLFLTH
jgi:hypothetical protein